MRTAVARVAHTPSHAGETGRFVVQLGAFANTAAAERAWSTASDRFNLASYSPVSGKANAANLIRLSVGGFATQDAAGQICGHIRASGGTCFVRVAQNDVLAQWVQHTKPARVAAR